MNIGLIGYGFMGGAHAAAITHIPGATLAAVASHNKPSADGPTRGNLDLKTEPLPDTVRWTPDWREVVDDPAIDAIDICLPTPMHREAIERAFANGKHVLCEKPMALTNSDCEELLAIARASGKVFMIAHVLRWMQPYPYAFQFVKKTNDIATATLRRSTGYPHWSGWLRDIKVSGGAIPDLLLHDLDQALQWFGDPITVSATSIGEVDTMRASLRYADKEIIVEGGWLAPETPFAASFSITANNASLTFADNKLIETHGSESHEVKLPEHDAYYDEIAYFIECCRTGSAPALCTPESSAKAVRLALLLMQSRDNNGKEISWQ
jgi:predicted dehydrogenase